MERGLLMSLVLGGTSIILTQIIAFVPRAISARFRVVCVHRDVVAPISLRPDEDATFAKPAPRYGPLPILTAADINLSSQMLPASTGHCHQLLDRNRAARQLEISDQDGALMAAQDLVTPEVRAWRSSPVFHARMPLRRQGAADGQP